MIPYEQWCRLKQLAERDRLSAAQIARVLGLAARTVRKWLKEPYRPRKRLERASVLDPLRIPVNSATHSDSIRPLIPVNSATFGAKRRWAFFETMFTRPI